MIAKLKHFFIDHWQRKLIALASAVVIWFLINHSITMTRTIGNIPIKIINLPPNRTIEGLLPSGFLKKRATITLNGNKDSLQSLEASDLQVVINTQNRGDYWVEKIDKKSLHSLNPHLDLNSTIHDISGNDIVIRLSPVMTEKIPIRIHKPIGNPPRGYYFLDIWPQVLEQTVTGPEEDVQRLQSKGLDLTFDLSKISASDLDDTKEESSEEVSFLIPGSWKYVTIPFEDTAKQKINDPKADLLKIDFLRSMLFPLGDSLPISLFFPLKTSQEANPTIDALQSGSFVEEMNGIPVLKLPLFAKDVSKLFLDVVRNNLQIIIIADPDRKNSTLDWSIQFVNPQALENAYVAEGMKDSFEYHSTDPIVKEMHLRKRFRTYLHCLEIYTHNQHKLELEPVWKDNKIIIEIAKP